MYEYNLLFGSFISSDMTFKNPIHVGDVIKLHENITCSDIDNEAKKITMKGLYSVDTIIHASEGDFTMLVMDVVEGIKTKAGVTIR